MVMVPGVALLAGLDPTGGAGLVADTLALHDAGVRSLPILTANTIQGPNIQTEFVCPDPHFFQKQLHSIFLTHSPAAIKTGMLGVPELIHVFRLHLQQMDSPIPVVMDPVLAASSGGLLIQGDLRTAILECGRFVTLVTPNIPELRWLAGINREETDERIIEQGVAFLGNHGFCGILVKGGHLSGSPQDRLFYNHHCVWQQTGARYSFTIRGTGCRLSSFIAARMALGDDLVNAVNCAYDYVQSLFRSERDRRKNMA